MKLSKTKYNSLLKHIDFTIKTARSNVSKAINTELVKVNWEIGRHIVKFEQEGKERAEYGSALIESLSRDLQKKHGKGFGRRNLLDMRRFYLAYQKWQTVSAKFSWSHFVALIGVSNDIARKFYEKQCILENWSVREPIGIIISADKDEILVEYATGGLSNKIFVSKYQLYLPDQKLLKKKVREILNYK